MKTKNYNKNLNIVLNILVTLLFLSMFFVDFSLLLKFKPWGISVCTNFKNNSLFIIKLIKITLPILIMWIVFVAYKLHCKKWVFKIEKLTLGGVNIILDNPDDLLKKQIKNFLNTKRTLFKIDDNKDNFYETIESYYSTYNFLKEEMKIFDYKSSKDSKVYEKCNEMIEKLNTFLSNNQNDFRRWYNYMIDNKIEEIYDKDISEIQKKYKKYPYIVEDFKIVNEYFCDIANFFDINIKKWDIPEKVKQGND